MKHHLARYARAVDFTTQPAEYFAYHDLLTGLPNRAAFSAHLTRTVVAASATATSFAVVCFDLDRFKDINDTFGHAVGDDVLNAVATRLKLAAQDQFALRIVRSILPVVGTHDTFAMALRRIVLAIGLFLIQIDPI